MKTITLKDITNGEEIIVKEIDDSSYSTGIDGHTTRTVKTKWIYAETGNNVEFQHHEYLRNAEVGSLIGGSHKVIKID
ncbi:hypothetical protein EA702_11510 [Acinetobacter baumannii]|uniref:hypothetical protein n=1 Tax=Acinetobacter baumannii TaxID=470 RepID=UPI00040F68A2|nr:hypothetical protein [Acinetobacter baumannii]MCT9260475.1 hypothetical protein [Acinetobacter baumannii]RSQ54939.1 hypothetical protein EA702_11510 [Acinetobacter baumannii]HAV5002487.1 hypothetical protein [Acinetobacter baumannii]HAV5032189.1 hypothetical protein [Acinetobacter baumannii]